MQPAQGLHLCPISRNRGPGRTKWRASRWRQRVVIFLRCWTGLLDEPPAQVTFQVLGVMGVAVFLCFYLCLGLGSLAVTGECQAGQCQVTSSASLAHHGFTNACSLWGKSNHLRHVGRSENREVQGCWRSWRARSAGGSLARNFVQLYFPRGKSSEGILESDVSLTPSR